MSETTTPRAAIRAAKDFTPGQTELYQLDREYTKTEQQQFSQMAAAFQLQLIFVRTMLTIVKEGSSSSAEQGGRVEGLKNPNVAQRLVDRIRGL